MSQRRARIDAAELEARYPWKYRRLAVLWVIGLCSAGIVYLTLKGADSRLNETLANGYFLLLGAVVGSYVFGAVWHDRGLMQSAAEVGETPFPVTYRTYGTRRRPTKLDNEEESTDEQSSE